MKRKQKQEEIETYLSGKLSAEQRHDFEVKMEKDVSLREEVKLHRGVEEALAETDIAELEEIIGEVYLRKRTVVRRRMIPRPMMLAAGVLLLIVAGFVLYLFLPEPPTPERLYQTYLDLPVELEEEMNFRSAELAAEKDATETAFLQAYREQSFDAALLEVENLKRASNSETGMIPGKYYFFEGVTLLQLDRKKEALKSFEQIKSGLYTESGDWYYAMTLLALEGASEPVKAAMEGIAHSSHPKRKDAQKMLQLLFNP